MNPPAPVTNALVRFAIIAIRCGFFCEICSDWPLLQEAQCALRNRVRLRENRDAGLLQDGHVLVYPPVPHAVARVADVERMQMLVEAAQRARLQAFLRDWVPALIALKREHKAVLRWAVDVDPLAI